MGIKTNLELPPSEDKVISAVVHLQCGKAGSLDNIPPGLIKFGRSEFVAKITAFYAHLVGRFIHPQQPEHPG